MAKHRGKSKPSPRKRKRYKSTRRSRSTTPKSPVARAMQRAARLVRTGHRTHLLRPQDPARHVSWSRNPNDVDWTQRKLVAADKEIEAGGSGRRALGVKHRLARPKWVHNHFLTAYVDAALWSSRDESDVPLDRNYGITDVASQTLAAMKRDCDHFRRECAEDLESVDEEQAGHDFWLTRNGHGVGFTDRGLGDLGQRLAAAARRFGDVNLYVHNGRVHSD